MTKRIRVACHELERQYIHERQTAQQIGVVYGCSASTVLRQLARCGIEARPSRFQAVAVPEAILRQLYLDQRLPLQLIAKKLGVSYGTIVERLRRYGVARRKPIVAKQQLRRLWSLGLSIDAIAELAAASPGAIIAAVAGDEQSIAATLSGAPAEPLRAYLSGLRRCWLAAERHADSIIAFARAQAEPQRLLFANALGSHAPLAKVELGERGAALVAALPGSWSFLLAGEDRLPNWVRAEPALLAAFVAALIDGAGNILLYPSPQIEIIAAGRGMLRQLGNDLRHWGLSLQAPQLWQPASEERWILQVSGAGIGRLLRDLAPHLRHPAQQSELLTLGIGR